MDGFPWEARELPKTPAWWLAPVCRGFVHKHRPDGKGWGTIHDLLVVRSNEAKLSKA